MYELTAIAAATLVRLAFRLKYTYPKLDAIRLAFWDNAQNPEDIIQRISDAASKLDEQTVIEVSFCHSLIFTLKAKSGDITINFFLESALDIGQFDIKKSSTLCVNDYLQSRSTNQAHAHLVVAAFATEDIDPALKLLTRAFWKGTTVAQMQRPMEVAAETLEVVGQNREMRFCRNLREATRETVKNNDNEITYLWFLESVLETSGWVPKADAWDAACDYVDRKRSRKILKALGEFVDEVERSSRRSWIHQSAFQDISMNPLRWLF